VNGPMTGVHVPACLSLADHIDAAVRETAGSAYCLGEFVMDVQAQWAQEQQMADADDEAVIRYWQRVQNDWMQRQGVSQ
jgi:hypothetical protein